MIDRRKKNFFRLWKNFLSHEKLPKLDRWLKAEFKKNPNFGKRDRAWYSEKLFQSCRFAWTVWAESKSDLSILEFLRSCDPEAFFASIENRVNSGAFSETGLSPDLESLFLNRAKVSKWSSGEQQKFLHDLTTRPPLWIRCNLPCTKENLAKHEIVAEGNYPSYTVQSSKSLYDNPLYKEGVFEIQDWASQQIGFHLPLKAGDKVWDACAGGGGKTLQLAARLEGSGEVYASDIRAYKLEELERRLKRTPLQNVRTFVWNGDEISINKFAELRGEFFDSVLVDAPCSSSGTLRRNPDLKLSLSQEIPQALLALQLRLLKNASMLVKKGGHLVYATCSFFVEENESIVAKFLEESANFQLVDQKLHGSPHADSDTTFSAVLTQN